jgi:transcriptional regulator with XRE-family HTH domain
VTAAATIRTARHRAALSLRQLAARAGTSHSTLAAYESGRKVPSVETLERVLRAAGFVASLELSPAVGGADAGERGRELVEVLELAARFPARHEPTLTFPRFGG